MWPTSTGTRTLRGAEAALLASGIVVMLDSLDERLSDDDEEPSDDDDDRNSPTADMQLGIAVFDSLTIPQRVAMLHHVSKHLLTDAVPFSEETSAVDDATVAAIFSEIQDQLTIEIDFYREEENSLRPSQYLFVDAAESEYWRAHVLAAFHQVYPDSEDQDAFQPPSTAQETSLEVWESLIDLLASAILWDRDFELANGFLDEDPDSARQRKRLLGIHDDYFIEPPLDPTSSQTKVLLAQARSIASRRPR